MSIIKKIFKKTSHDPFAHQAGNLTVEDVSFEAHNHTNRKGEGPPQTWIFKSTREHERIDWLQFEVGPGDFKEIPHGRYRHYTDDGKPVRGCYFAYGKSKHKYKN